MSRRNRYYQAIVAFRMGRWADAAEGFERALELKCPTAVQRDFCAFITTEAREALAEARANQARGTRERGDS